MPKTKFQHESKVSFPVVILIQVNLPYNLNFLINFGREIPDNSYPSQLTIQDLFSHWLQQGDS